MHHKKIQCYCALFGILLLSSLLATTNAFHTPITLKDNTSPEVAILNPSEGYLHLSGKPIIPNPFTFVSDTISFGGFRFKKVIISAHDNIDFEADLEVKFYLNGEEKAVGSFVPCDLTWEWQWTGRAIGKYNLMVTAEDLSDNIGSTEMDVWYFSIIP